MSLNVLSRRLVVLPLTRAKSRTSKGGGKKKPVLPYGLRPPISPPAKNFVLPTTPPNEEPKIFRAAKNKIPQSLADPKFSKPEHIDPYSTAAMLGDPASLARAMGIKMRSKQPKDKETFSIPPDASDDIFKHVDDSQIPLTPEKWSKFKNAARSYFNQGVIELRVQDYQPRMKLGRVTKRKFIEDKKKGPIASRLDAAMGPSKASYEMPSFDDDTAELQGTPYEPMPQYPSICVIGRSNVGKSSLLNALISTKNPTFQASKTPGRTRKIQYAVLASKLTLVDLPGYGYAKVPPQVLKEMSDRLTSFFTHESPKRVFILIDARRGIGAADEKHMELIESVGIPHQLVITKVDKIPAHQIKKVEREILDKIKKKPLVFPYVLKTSASSGIGIAEMQVEVAMACGLAEERRKELYSDD